MTDDGIDRRGLLGLPFAAAAAGWAGAAAAQGRGRSAVVFLSRSGNTRVLAGALSRRFGADVFEVRPRDPWPADYEEMVAWASTWRERSEPIPLAESFDLTGYGTIFLGFPIWGMALPAPMRSFLAGHDLSGRTVLPFVTHGGYGAGNAMETVAGLVPDARLAETFVLECDQERDTLRRLGGWLDTVRGDLPG